MAVRFIRGWFSFFFWRGRLWGGREREREGKKKTYFENTLGESHDDDVMDCGIKVCFM